MKLDFKRSLIAASIAAGIFGASAFAVAQTPESAAAATTTTTEATAEKMVKPGAGKGDMKGKQRMAKMQKHKAEHQAKLKASLKLKPEQEAAWTSFVADTDHAPRMANKDGAKREDMAKLTTPERIDKMMARHAERSAEMTKRMDATKAFYASLDPEQQKTFDAQPRGGFQRASMKRGDGHQKGQRGHKMHQGEGMDKMKMQDDAAKPTL